MEAMLHKIQNFFLNLQQETEEIKKLWLFVLAAGSMLVVLTVWVFYINLTVKSLGAAEDKQGGFFQTLGVGMQIISKESGLRLSKLMGRLKSAIGKKNSLTIQGANFNFIANDLDPVKPKKLP